MSRPVLEVADIFRDHGAAWREANRGHVSLGQLTQPPEKTGPDGSPVLPRPCPCCGGRMIVIEVFARGSMPKYRPPGAAPVRADTS